LTQKANNEVIHSKCFMGPGPR